MAPKINCDKSGTVLPGFRCATYLSFFGPTTWTLELCFKRSSKRISNHFSVGSGQNKECFWTPALSKQQYELLWQNLVPWGAGRASKHGAVLPASALNSCADPRVAFRRFFSSPWLHVNAEGTNGFCFIRRVGTEYSTKGTPRCLPLCFGPALEGRFAVEAVGFLPYCSSCARGRKKWLQRSKAGSSWMWFCTIPTVGKITDYKLSSFRAQTNLDQDILSVHG